MTVPQAHLPILPLHRSGAGRLLGCAVLTMAMLFVLLLPEPARAQATLNEYQLPNTYEYDVGDGTGRPAGIRDLEVNTTFDCDGAGHPVGNLFINPTCENPGIMGIFANVVCRIENLFGNILGLLYCSMQVAILPPLIALLTLYVVVYGAMVLLGMVGHTFREALTRVFKIALVVAIAMNAGVAIQVGYKFYISFAQQSVSIILSVFDTGGDGPTEFNELVQAGYALSPTYEDPSRRMYNGEHWITGLDATIQQMLGVFIDAGPKIIIVLVALFIFMPPVFFVLLYLLISVFKALTEAIIGYLLALLGITLLFTLAPIFVSFALFKVTAGYFNTWLQYLASFTLQMMVVFAFLMMMIMVDIFSFFQQAGTLVRSYQYDLNFGFFHYMLQVPSLCKVKRDDGHNIKYYYFQTQTPVTLPDGTVSHLLDCEGSSCYTTQMYAGFPKCEPNYTLERALTGTDADMPPGITRAQWEDLREEIEYYYTDGNTFGVDYEADSVKQLEEIINKANNDLVLPFFEMLTTTDLLTFLLVRFIVVIILTYLMDKFMKKVPHIATHLGGTKFQGRMGGGIQDENDSVGLQDTRDTGGLMTGFERFRLEGMYDGGSGNPITGAPGRFGRGVGGMISGMASGMVNRSVRQAMGLGTRGALSRHSNMSESVRERMLVGELVRTRQDRAREQARRPHHTNRGRGGPGRRR